MSNAFLKGDGSSPPAVPTQFTTDVFNNGTTGPGTAIPSGNNLNLKGRQTVVQNDNGIRSDADLNNSANCYVELTNRATGTLTTNDATVTTIITFDLGASAGTFYLYGNVQGFNASTPASGAYSFSGGYRTNGTLPIELGTEFHDTFQDVLFESTDITLVPETNPIVGNFVYLKVQGIAATTIDWNALLEFRRVL